MKGSNIDLSLFYLSRKTFSPVVLGMIGGAGVLTALVPAVALVAVWFMLQGGRTIVALLLMGCSFVTQLFPSLIMSLTRENPVPREAAFIGICAGAATVAVISSTHATLAGLFPRAPEVFQHSTSASSR